MDPRQAGFTLLEMTVALVILGAAAALVLPDRSGGAVELKAAARDMAAGLRRTREAALMSNKERVFMVDVSRRVWRAADSPERPLPKAVNIALTTATSERLSAGAADIRFFPDGGASGGGIRLERGGQAYVIRVNWLTGRVEVGHED